eukprot:TRINITY_DN6726_c0_g2_i1.p1 TRINITY_DN6726_c0_g2~~TRINITY_DN6726_c0_g2_i1.p1  ORF type:complete len:126 (+),score=13.49 TRINITY_DN6726_c0_g2_i1:34-411(+)
MEENGTLVIRVIRSFPHRNIRNIVLKSVPLKTTGDQLLELSKQSVASSTSLPPPFRNYEYDTLKIEHHAHGAKSNDPVINKDDDDKLILKPELSLRDSGVKNETEISLFKMNDYQAYKENSETKW